MKGGYEGLTQGGSVMVRVCGSNTGREGDGVREQHRERASVTVRV